MIALRPNGLGRRLGKTGIALDRLVVLFHFPPFLVDCLDVATVQCRVTRHQIENALAAVLVCKDLRA